MKRKEDPTKDWVSPQGLLKNLNKRQLNLASAEENKKHLERVLTPGTPENVSHTKITMRRYMK